MEIEEGRGLAEMGMVGVVGGGVVTVYEMG